MLVLALALVPAVVLPIVFDLPGPMTASLVTVGWIIWAAFLFEYLVKLYLAPRRWHMVRTHVFDLVIIAVPILRPLRALHSLRALSATSGLVRAAQAVRRLTRRRGFRTFIALVLLVIVLSATAVWMIERDHPGTQFSSFGDVLWWAIFTGTTIGQPERFPVTLEGRALGIVLMMFRVSLLAMITAHMAAYFIERDGDENRDDITERLDRIEALLARQPDVDATHE